MPEIPPATRFLGRYVHSYLTFFALTILDGRVVACSNYIKESYLRLGWPLGSRDQGDLQCRGRPALSNSCRLVLKPGGEPEIIMVGTLEQHKDQPTLIRAMRRLKDLGSGLRCRIVRRAARVHDELAASSATQEVGDVCGTAGFAK